MSKWCHMYDMWCDDVEYEIDKGLMVCDRICNGCEWCEKIRPMREYESNY